MEDSIQDLLEQVDDVLTDSQHPLDARQSTRISLMLQRQIVNMQLSMKREMLENQREIKAELGSLHGNLASRRAALDERIEKIEDEVKAIKTLMSEYPSLAWLIRYRTTPTVRFLVAAAVVIYILLKAYSPVAAWLGLPPIP